MLAMCTVAFVVRATPKIKSFALLLNFFTQENLSHARQNFATRTKPNLRAVVAVTVLVHREKILYASGNFVGLFLKMLEAAPSKMEICPQTLYAHCWEYTTERAFSAGPEGTSNECLDYVHDEPFAAKLLKSLNLSENAKRKRRRRNAKNE